MTMFDSIRKALLAGIGVPEKVKELIDDLVKKGELSKSQGAKLIKEWSDKISRSEDEFGKTISEIINKTFEKMNIPTRDEVEKLNRKVLSLSARLRKLEEASEKTAQKE